MKPKWWWPASPIVGVILTDPHMQRDLVSRWLAVLGALLLTTVLLGIIQPWRAEP